MNGTSGARLSAPRSAFWDAGRGPRALPLTSRSFPTERYPAFLLGGELDCSPGHIRRYRTGEPDAGPSDVPQGILLRDGPNVRSCGSQLLRSFDFRPVAAWRGTHFKPLERSRYTSRWCCGG